MTTYRGINYGQLNSNVGAGGIRYAVIPQNDILQAWVDSSEPEYGCPQEFECPECNQSTRINCKDDPKIEWGDIVLCPNCGEENECELPDTAEPLGFVYASEGYKMHQTHDDTDVWITSSPYFTYAQFCSPCAPGACHLRKCLAMDKMEQENHGEWVMAKRENRCFCLGPDWFEDGIAPYPIYSITTGELI